MAAFDIFMQSLGWEKVVDVKERLLQKDMLETENLSLQ